MAAVVAKSQLEPGRLAGRHVTILVAQVGDADLDVHDRLGHQGIQPDQRDCRPVPLAQTLPDRERIVPACRLASLAMPVIRRHESILPRAMVLLVPEHLDRQVKVIQVVHVEELQIDAADADLLEAAEGGPGFRGNPG